jgi:cytochrome c-type biogenesis protein CcmE
MRKARGLFLPLVAGIAGVGVLVAFAQGGSSYLSVKEARMNGGQSIHVAGTIDTATLKERRKAGDQLEFDLVDPAGDRIHVRHVGEPPANLGEAKKVVVVGRVEGGNFISERMLVKCPTKYKDEEAQAK